MKSDLFNQGDLERIAAAVGEAEKHTSGEIVTLVCRRSGDYRWVHLLLGVAGALIGVAVALVRHLGFPDPGDWSHGSLTFVEVMAGFAAGVAISFWSPLKRRLVPRAMRARKVHRESLANFVAAGVANTRDRTGILIYLSEFEHQVEILGDKGIHDKVGPNFWDAQARHIVDGIHGGRPADAIVEALQSMAKALVEHFPRRPDDRDELHNRVLLGPQY